MRAGLPVPPGFVVTTAAYRSFVAGNESQMIIDIQWRSCNPNNPETFEQASRVIRVAFELGVFLPGLKSLCSAPIAHCATATLTAVAVRSSATAEDLPEASFAGQQDTYLNVIGVARSKRR